MHSAQYTHLASSTFQGQREGEREGGEEQKLGEKNGDGKREMRIDKGRRSGNGKKRISDLERERVRMYVCVCVCGKNPPIFGTLFLQLPGSAKFYPLNPFFLPLHSFNILLISHCWLHQHKFKSLVSF